MHLIGNNPADKYNSVTRSPLTFFSDKNRDGINWALEQVDAASFLTWYLLNYYNSEDRKYNDNYEFFKERMHE